MKYGEIWTVAGAGDYSSKPRPALIIQDDILQGHDSVIIALITSQDIGSAWFRVPVQASRINGLEKSSFIMIDKIRAVPRTKLGALAGHLSSTEMSRVRRGLATVLGLARRH